MTTSVRPGHDRVPLSHPRELLPGDVFVGYSPHGAALVDRPMHDTRLKSLLMEWLRALHRPPGKWTWAVVSDIADDILDLVVPEVQAHVISEIEFGLTKIESRTKESNADLYKPIS